APTCAARAEPPVPATPYAHCPASTAATDHVPSVDHPYVISSRTISSGQRQIHTGQDPGLVHALTRPHGHRVVDLEPPVRGSLHRQRPLPDLAGGKFLPRNRLRLRHIPDRLRLHLTRHPPVGVHREATGPDPVLMHPLRRVTLRPHPDDHVVIGTLTVALTGGTHDRAAHTVMQHRHRRNVRAERRQELHHTVRVDTHPCRPRRHKLLHRREPVRAEHEISRHRPRRQRGVHTGLHPQIRELPHQFTRDRRDTARRPRHSPQPVLHLLQQAMTHDPHPGVSNGPLPHLKPTHRHSPRPATIQRLQTDSDGEL